MYDVNNDIQNDKYDLDRFINPVDNSKTTYFDIVDSEFLFKLKSLDRFGTYNVIFEEGRPDLLSERIYGVGNTQYWWLLMYFNNIRLPRELKRGTTIRYPLIVDLENIYVNLLPHIGSSRASITVKQQPLVRREILD